MQYLTCSVNVRVLCRSAKQWCRMTLKLGKCFCRHPYQPSRVQLERWCLSGTELAPMPALFSSVACLCPLLSCQGRQRWSTQLVSEQSDCIECDCADGINGAYCLHAAAAIATFNISAWSAQASAIFCLGCFLSSCRDFRALCGDSCQQVRSLAIAVLFVT